jgi:hypothetical protein
METIKQKREKVKPRIKQLREWRSDFNELETDYLEKKQKYDAMKNGFETNTEQLVKEIESSKENLRTQQSLFHQMQCQDVIIEAVRKRAKEEVNFRTGNSSYSAEFKSYRDMFEKRIPNQTQRIPNKSKNY